VSLSLTGLFLLSSVSAGLIGSSPVYRGDYFAYYSMFLVSIRARLGFCLLCIQLFGLRIHEGVLGTAFLSVTPWLFRGRWCSVAF